MLFSNKSTDSDRPTRILIANRGEIALRIARTCKSMGIETVGIHSDVDSDLIHLKMMDATVCVGPAEPAKSYLNIPAIISAMEVTGAEAVHPGYGFLSENAEFADKVVSSGYQFIGPKGDIIRKIGDKATARRIMIDLGLPVLPGSDGLVADAAEAAIVAREIEYPVILKATAGGGGRGTRVVFNEKELREAFAMASEEARQAFGDGAIYLEKFLQRPQHIEVQIACDGTRGIHLYERNCSLQRRRQKIFEEGPVNFVNERALTELRKKCVRACEKLGYEGVGTIETLYEDGKFYFLEMNTRIQVEHPVTEMITGIDLVELQMRIAFGEKMPYQQSEVECRGHAVECRINAEDPENFTPSPGVVTELHAPAGPWVRFDSHLYSGYRVPPNYDSLVAKLVCWGDTRQIAFARMDNALQELHMEGIKTLQPLHLQLLKDPTLLSEDVHVNYLENEYLKRRTAPSDREA
ncbi:MAG: acetyl-CoA carboxylase biotin carboxylase subunit [Gammaproteobacteria bacterium]